MEGWRIAVLCVMIGVFVIAVIALLFFAWSTGRCGFATTSSPASVYAREPSATVFHFYDFSSPRRLISLDLTKWEGAPIGGGGGHRNNGNGGVPPLDLNGIGSAQNGAAVYDLHRKDHFLHAIAQLIGDTDAPTLAVSRQDPGGVLVELDLDDFLARGKRDDHMRGTALAPCALTRHFSFDRDYHFDQSSPLYNNNGNASAFVGSNAGGGGFSRAASGFGSRNVSRVAAANAFVDPHGSGPPSQMYTPRSARNNHNNTTAAYASYNNNNSTSREMGPMGGGMPLPAPLILPISPNITINTPITLSSALYVFEDAGGSGGNAYPYGRAAGGGDEVPTAMAERLEQLITIDRSNGTFTVAPNAIATINVKQQSAVVKYTNGAAPRRVQRCVTSLPIAYAYEGPDQLVPYTPGSPIYLPAGRWSLCAQVRNEFGTDFRTQSRVFTVEVGR